jgi:hypothetical protein
MRWPGHRLFHFRIAEDNGPSSRSCSQNVAISIWRRHPIHNMGFWGPRKRIKLAPPVSSAPDWASLDPDCFSNNLPQRRLEPNGNIFRWCGMSFPTNLLPGLHSVSLSSSSRERQGWLATHGARRCQLLVMYLSGVPYAVRPCWLRKPPRQLPLLYPGRRCHQLQAGGRANIYPLCRSRCARSTARLAGWIWYVLQLMYVLVHHNLEVEDDPNGPRPCNES